MKATFFSDQRETGRIATSIDWSNHPLGRWESWPQSLKTSVNIMLNSQFPMFISWGKERYFLYNDAYAVILGQKHPKAFGDKFYNIWSEIWPDIEPLILSVEQGKAVFLEDLKLIMNRYGYDEETYFTFSYSPIENEEGKVEGLFCAVHETSAGVFALRVRDEFLSIASHELKTPLTTLKIQSQFLKKVLEKDDASKIINERIPTFIVQTEKQTARLSRLIDDMLDVSRIQTGKLTIAKTSFDMCELVRDVLNRMEGDFISNNYEIPQIATCPEATGKWDQLRIEQVLMNLFTNSIRYGKGNPISVSVDATEESITIKVKDNGIGISEENQNKIFNRFERVSSLSEMSGLGIGLFLTRQIVDAHKGKVWIESKLDTGSTFYVELPRNS